jgi:hypothetical protein
MNLSNVDGFEYLDTGVRLFTQTPYPEFDYIVTPNYYKYCANQSLYSYLRRTNFWLKWVDVTPDLVLRYVEEQTAILRYNNQDLNKTECLFTLLKLFKWGSEDPLQKIALDTVDRTVSMVFGTDDVEDIIDMQVKNVWYSDRIMKPIRYQEETWLQYVERIRAGKIRCRVQYKNFEAKSILQEESNSIQQNSGGIIPTAQILNQRTEIPVRKIKEVTEEDIVWQTKTKMHLQTIQKLKEQNPNITQLEIAEFLGVTDRQVRKMLST